MRRSARRSEAQADRPAGPRRRWAADGGFRVRPVTGPERAAWIRLRTKLWPAPERTRADLAREADEYLGSLGRTHGRFGPLPARVWIASVPHGSPVGFVEATLRPTAEGCDTHPVGYLEGWYVEPDHRRRGIGRALVEAAEYWARSEGCTEMASDARADNPLGISSHEALGFRVVERAVHFRRPIRGVGAV